MQLGRVLLRFFPQLKTLFIRHVPCCNVIHQYATRSCTLTFFSSAKNFFCKVKTLFINMQPGLVL